MQNYEFPYGIDIDIVARADVLGGAILVGTSTYVKATQPWCVALGINDQYAVVASFRTEREARAYANKVWTYARTDGLPGWMTCTRLVPVAA